MATRQPLSQGDLSAEPRSVELRDYAQVVRRRWVLVLVVIVLGAALAFGYGVHKGHVYAATSDVVVQPATQGPLNPPAAPNLQVNMVTEQAVAESAPVAALAAKLMHSPLSAAVAQGKLASHLAVTVPTLSNVLQLTWQAGSPKDAQQGADAFANAYLTYRHELLAGQITALSVTLNSQMTTLRNQIKSVTAQLSNSVSGTAQRQNLDATLGQLQGQLTKASDTYASLATYNTSGGTVINAALPLHATGLRRSLLLLLGAIIGLLAGIVAAFVRDAFDDRLRDPAVFEEKLGAPLLAVLPASTNARAAITRPESRAADAFRALRTTLTSVTAGKDLCSLVVVGVDSSVSSSHVAAGLSAALAEAGRVTLLIGTDIHGSMLPKIFDVPGTVGLTNVLVGKTDPETVVQYPQSAGGTALPSVVAQRLSLIPSGPPLGMPLSMLDSVAMARFLKSLSERYDFVVLDSPPGDSAADVLALARLADGVVVVASEGRTKGRAVAGLRQRLDRIGGYLAGGIFVARGTAFGGRHGREGPRAQLASESIVGNPAESSRADRAEPAEIADAAAGRSQPAGPDATVNTPERSARGPS